MCTGFVKKGRDVISGFSFDADAAVWDYRVVKSKSMFYIGIKVGSALYRVHGVNSNGSFGNLPYMNAPGVGEYRRKKGLQRLDLLVGSYISGKCTYAELLDTVKNKALVNAPGVSMHSLFSDADGHMLLAEPGLGCRELSGDYSVISNFPLIERPSDLSAPELGFDRYKAAEELLKNSGDGFDARDGLRLLAAVRQGGAWATRVSFVYSRNENRVYYFLNGDCSVVMTHDLV